MSDLFNGRCLTERPAPMAHGGPGTTRSMRPAGLSPTGTLSSAPKPLFASSQQSLFARGLKAGAMVLVVAGVAACGGGGAGGTTLSAGAVSPSAASSAVTPVPVVPVSPVVPVLPVVAPVTPVASAPATSPVVPVVLPPGLPAPTRSTSLAWRGVNLSGAEFGSALPGHYGYEYLYPAAASVGYYKAKGMNTVRLPFLWERLQPTLNQAFDADELARIVAFVDPVTATGMTVILDPHNYATWRGQQIGSSGVPNAAFADFWSRLATRFKANPKVVFGLMNEPNSMPTEQWLAGANAALASIRSAGAGNVVFVPGNAWTGAGSWSDNWYGTPNATAMKNVVDPGDNIVFELHTYLDSDSSGTSAACVSASIGVDRLQGVTAWMRTNHRRAFLGEFAGGDNATCNAAVANLLTFMEANPDVWSGWSWWGGGPWWGNYMYALEPANGIDKPQMAVLAPFLD